MTAEIPLLPDQAGWDEIKALAPGYETMLRRELETILDRFERDPEYCLIDTKLDLRTGRDFYPVNSKEEAFRSREVIYSWTQSRGMEALAGHLRWLAIAHAIKTPERNLLAGRIRKLLTTVINTMEEIRSVNHGRVYFCMTAGGSPLEIVKYKHIQPAEYLMPESNYSDLFYSRGLFAAAWELGWGRKTKDAITYFKKVLDDIEDDHFLSDRQAFEPHNVPRYQPGKFAAAPFRTALAGLALFGAYNQDADWFGYASRFITRIIDNHINLDGRIPELPEYDFFEEIDSENHPWRTDDKIAGDPGRAIEFIAHAAKCLVRMRKLPEHQPLLERCLQIFPPLLIHQFELGYNPQAEGICRRFDLKSRKALSPCMPSWNLPATMRAAALLIALDGDSQYRPQLENILRLASNAFSGKYLNPDAGMLPYTARGCDGKILDTILETPDFDPAYYSGLSLIDVIKVIDGHRV